MTNVKNLTSSEAYEQTSNINGLDESETSKIFSHAQQKQEKKTNWSMIAGRRDYYYREAQKQLSIGNNDQFHTHLSAAGKFNDHLDEKSKSGIQFECTSENPEKFSRLHETLVKNAGHASTLNVCLKYNINPEEAKAHLESFHRNPNLEY